MIIIKFNIFSTSDVCTCKLSTIHVYTFVHGLSAVPQSTKYVKHHLGVLKVPMESKKNIPNFWWAEYNQNINNCISTYNDSSLSVFTTTLGCPEYRHSLNSSKLFFDTFSCAITAACAH